MRHAIISIFVTLLSFNALAQSKNTAPDNSELFYCPEKVTCTRDGDINSCTHEQQPSKYWTFSKYQHPDYVFAGEYELTNIQTSFHSNHAVHGWRTSCNYENSEVNTRYIQVGTVPYAGLEAYYDENTNWTIYPTGGASCDSQPSATCPLKKASALIVLNTTEKKLGINHKKPFLSPIVEIWPGSLDEPRVGGISYDQIDTIYHCNESNLCNLALSVEGDFIAEVIVDLDNKLKIHSYKALNPSLYTLSQIDNFNAIEVHKGKMEGTLTIHNSLSTKVQARQYKEFGSYILLTEMIEPGMQATIPYEKLATTCAQLGECTIHFLTEKQMSIGNVDVDYLNGMEVAGVDNDRPSEIYIQQTSHNKLEVRYANF